MTHTKQLLLVTFCDNTAGNGALFQTHGRKEPRTEPQTDPRTDGQTDMTVEIFI